MEYNELRLQFSGRANVGGKASTCKLAWTCPIWVSLEWACSACSWTGGALGSGPLPGSRWGARWCKLLPWAKKNFELIIRNWRKVWTQNGSDTNTLIDFYRHQNSICFFGHEFKLRCSSSSAVQVLFWQKEKFFSQIRCSLRENSERSHLDFIYFIFSA